MPICSRCNGDGFRESVDYEEQIRGIEDSCYHCSESGKVDEETDFRDRLEDLAVAISWGQLREYKRALSEDPYEDGWELRAAENGLRSHEYDQDWVYGHVNEVLDRLESMSREEREFMLAEDGNWFGSVWKKHIVPAPVVYAESCSTDDIPF
jgi:hypothetical protein